MVIQEAMVHGRPLLVSDIGGMREKVKDGVTGFHVPPRNPMQWASHLSRAASLDPQAWDALRQQTPHPLCHAACAREHLRLLQDEPTLA